MKNCLSILIMVFFTSILSAQRLTTDQLYITYGNSQFLKSVLKMELISKADFTQKEKEEVNFLDTTQGEIHKLKGVLTLPCGEGSVEFKDNPMKGADFAEYEYVGQIKILNAFVVGFMYPETSGYSLIDRKTGEEIEVFEEFPQISPDKKHIIVLRQDAVDITASISLYNITADGVEMEVSDNFENWTIDSDMPVFWGKDNKLYFTVVSIKDYKENTDRTKFRQYIRLSLL